MRFTKIKNYIFIFQIAKCSINNNLRNNSDCFYIRNLLNFTSDATSNSIDTNSKDDNTIDITSNSIDTNSNSTVDMLKKSSINSLKRKNSSVDNKKPDFISLLEKNFMTLENFLIIYVKDLYIKKEINFSNIFNIKETEDLNNKKVIEMMNLILTSFMNPGSIYESTKCNNPNNSYNCNSHNPNNIHNKIKISSSNFFNDYKNQKLLVNLDCSNLFIETIKNVRSILNLPENRNIFKNFSNNNDNLKFILDFYEIFLNEDIDIILKCNILEILKVERKYLYREITTNYSTINKLFMSLIVRISNFYCELSNFNNNDNGSNNGNNNVNNLSKNNFNNNSNNLSNNNDNTFNNNRDNKISNINIDFCVATLKIRINKIVKNLKIDNFEDKHKLAVKLFRVFGFYKVSYSLLEMLLYKNLDERSLGIKTKTLKRNVCYIIFESINIENINKIIKDEQKPIYIE